MTSKTKVHSAAKKAVVVPLTVGVLSIAVACQPVLHKAPPSAPVVAAKQVPPAGQLAAGKPVWKEPTVCEAERGVYDPAVDKDYEFRRDADLFVMFHGNRFVAAPAIVAAFEAANPGVRVSWTSLPPIYTIFKVAPEKIRQNMPKDIPEGLASQPGPDVVMLSRGTLAGLYGTAFNIHDAKLYSKVAGMVLVARQDSPVSGITDAIRRPDVRFVLAGGQNVRHHSTYSVPRIALGDAVVDDLLARATTSFSQVTHHRSIPARLLAGCGDAGFQYKQSEPYLRARFPGQFKFFDVPTDQRVRETLDADEDSYLLVASGTKNRSLAARFSAFMVGAEGQRILSKYHLDINGGQQR